MLVQDFLHRSAERWPSKTALVSDGRHWSYGELHRLANQFAHALRGDGLKVGDRVVLHLGNRVDTVIGIFGTLTAGGVFVCVNPSVKQDKLAYIVNDCRASILLHEHRTSESSLGTDWTHLCPSLCRVYHCAGTRVAVNGEPDLPSPFLDELARCPADRPAQRNIDLDLACLIYTSGTTGEPKGVMCGHDNVVFASGAIMEYLQNTESDIVLNALPLSFDYGLYQLLMTFRAGGTLVLESSFAYPATVLEAMVREHVTGLPGVPTFFSLLLNLDLAAYDLSSLRYLTNTAAALPENHIQKIRHCFAHATFFSMYGLTETKRTLYLPPSELDRRPGSVGIPIPGTQAWVEDDCGNRLGPGQIGELVVRGRHVMRGYWETPAASAERFRPGRIPGERLCYTGDLFRTDSEGFFYFMGRKDDIIKSRGEKVAPREIENVLYRLAAVREAAVIGVPDPVLGQAIKAFIVADIQTLTQRQVLAHCRLHLEEYMIPKHVEFLAALPKTDSGKISKLALH